MTTSTSLPLPEVEAHLSELVGRVGSQHERVVVTVRGEPSAVLIAPADLESLEETIAVLSDREGMRRMSDSEAELAAGLGESEAGLAAAVQNRQPGGALDLRSWRELARCSQADGVVASAAGGSSAADLVLEDGETRDGR